MDGGLVFPARVSGDAEADVEPRRPGITGERRANTSMARPARECSSRLLPQSNRCSSVGAICAAPIGLGRGDRFGALSTPPRNFAHLADGPMFAAISSARSSAPSSSVPSRAARAPDQPRRYPPLSRTERTERRRTEERRRLPVGFLEKREQKQAAAKEGYVHAPDVRPNYQSPTNRTSRPAALARRIAHGVMLAKLLASRSSATPAG